MKTNTILFTVFLFAATLLSCNHKRDSTTFGGSTDTTSINRAGGSAIADTATITANRNKVKKDSVKTDTTTKGNVDPSGHTPKK